MMYFMMYKMLYTMDYKKYDIRNVNLQRNQKMDYNVWQFSYTVNCVIFVYDGLQKYDIRNVNLQRNQKMDYNV